ncbi:MAG: sigma 54-interacting transcriptional regulator [Clostridiales Family XIII bacterium]|jgi:transcriptional regulator of acetoin/glycerol metabolism|nr:sigma 54-interacting transcriptional regulator [Clostridiales Family XIII bacterium]
MTPNNDEYQNAIARLWRRYIENDASMPDAPPDGIRPVIFESWRRAKRHKISPLEVKDKILSQPELAQITAQNKSLLSVAHSYTQNLYHFVKDSNFIIALTDSDGYVIDLIGVEGQIEARAQKSSLTVGCNRSERYAGTCGIGTCIAIGEPVQIWGYEHYIQPHHNYVCSAAPIRNKDGAVIACLDVIGPGDTTTQHTLAMVCAAADGIEKEMKMREAYEKMFIINHQLSSTLESISSGIVMFDNMGVVTQCNKRAALILKLPYDDIRGHNMADVLDLNAGPADLLDLSENISRLEFSVMNAAGAKLNLSVSASVIRNEQGEKRSTVLVMEEQHNLNKMATRISGFTAKYNFDDIIGASPALAEVKALGQITARSNSNVLILGESGTGKDLLAQAIHNASWRASGPFIPINCGSLPKGLVESELFGYESGSFTGASKNGCPGKFELAEGGTIFLDEIGDMSIEIQATLLRVLQTKHIIRIGGTASIPVDVRIIAATNVDLASRIEENRFRRDLYYRLNVLTFSLPPLRRHMSDVPLLIDHFISEYSARMSLDMKGISESALHRLMCYEWPGNIRELENIIERALNLATGDCITEKELGIEIPALPLQKIWGSRGEPDLPRGRENDPGLIMAALKKERGNVTKAALLLRTPKRTLYRQIKKFEIELRDFRLW